jgi:tRNA acetyltransferase TAN1
MLLREEFLMALILVSSIILSCILDLLTMNAYPKAIVTTGNNKGKKTTIELINRLLPYDNDVEIKEEIKNVLSIYSKLSPMEIYGLIASAPPSSAFKIFPFMDVAELQIETIIKKGVNLLLSKKVKKFYVECIQRTKEVNCREVEIGIGISMRGKAEVNYNEPDYVLFANIMKSFLGFSLFKNGQEKLSVSTLKLNMRK